MENTKSSINYIFYLQTKSDLDNTYYTLSEILNKLNISLLPITPEELNSLDKATKNHVIFTRNDLSSGVLFNQLRRTFFDLAMMSGRVFLHDLSSFSEIENSQRFVTKEAYRFIALPANVKQIAMNIAVDYFRDRNKRDEWPGGRRAKLPSMNTQN